MSQVEGRDVDGPRHVLAQAQRGAGSLVRALVRQGEAAADRVEHAIEDVLSRADARREAELAALRAEVATLQARVESLEARLAASEW
jgi:polyhydroxyalkanoate synthesis regulator phasin